MIKINEALFWLNQFEKSHLRRPIQSLIKNIQDPTTAEVKREQLISTVIKNSLSSHASMEYPEVLLNCASAQFEHEHYKAARDYAVAALRIYPDGSHHLGVARWIVGIIYQKLPNSTLAYSSWYQAREIFNNLEENAVAIQQQSNADWYRDHLTEMNVDLVSTAEEIYTWQIC